MSEELSDFPRAFLRPEPPYPWEEDPHPITWQWGLDKGKTLREIGSRELVRKRQWLEAKNGAGNYFADLIAEIDTVLLERQGE